MTMLARWAAVGAALVIGLFIAVLPASPAQAHAVLLRSDPAAGTVIPQAPSAVSLTFNEPVSPVRTGITVLAPDGAAVQRGKAERTDGGRQLRTDLRKNLDNGTYLVSYRLVSADGHPISGGYTFSVGHPSTAPTLDDDPGTDPVVRGALSVGRYATYVGAALLTGAVAMILLLWPRRLPTTVPRQLGWLGWWALIAGTVVWLWAEVPYVWGGSLTSLESEAISDTLQSTVGTAGLVRLGLLLAAFPLLRRVLRGDELGRVGTTSLVLLGVAAALTWPFSGHSANSPANLLSVPADAIHLGAMAFWLGGLLVLLTATLRQANQDELAVILPTWSRWALLALALVVFTGTIEGLLQLGSLRSLVDSTYGWLLVAKVAGVAVIIVIAAVARRWARRAGVTVTLRRAILAEVFTAAVVLGVATALTQTPPTQATSDQQRGDVPFTASVTTDDLIVQIDLDPARRGPNSVHVTSVDDRGRTVEVVEWKATAALPSRDIAPTEISLLPIDAGHASGEVYLAAAGEWEFRFTLRTSDVDQVTVKQLIPVK